MITKAERKALEARLDAHLQALSGVRTMTEISRAMTLDLWIRMEERKKRKAAREQARKAAKSEAAQSAEIGG